MEVSQNGAKDVYETNVTQRPHREQKALNLFETLTKKPTTAM
jgi:hypothetical protein